MRRIFARVAGVLCALMLLALCAVAVYDLCSPWLIASRELERYGRHCALCVGISSSSYRKSDGVESTFTSVRERAYALMRLPVSWPLLIFVSQDQNVRVTVEESALGFWVGAGLVGGFGLGAWRLCAGPLLGGSRQTRSANPAAAVDAPIALASHSEHFGRRATAQRRSDAG